MHNVLLNISCVNISSQWNSLLFSFKITISPFYIYCDCICDYRIPKHSKTNYIVKWPSFMPTL